VTDLAEPFLFDAYMWLPVLRTTALLMHFCVYQY